MLQAPNSFLAKFVFFAIISSGLLAPGASAQSADSLSLEAVVHTVIARSHVLRQLASQVNAADARTSQAKAAYYPSVNADLSYANIGPKDNYKFGTFYMAPQNNYDAHLDANLLLYDFGKRGLAIKATQIARNSLQHNAAGLTSTITFQAVSLATTMAMMQQGIAIQNENVSALERHLQIVKKRLATGTGTSYDTLRTCAQLAAAASQLLDLENGLDKMRITLAILMGVAQDSLRPVKIAFVVSEYHANADSLVARALDGRPEVIAASDALAGALLAEQLAKKEMVPVLSAGLTTGFKNGFILNAPNGLDTMRFNWSAAAALHFPLCDGFKTHYHQKELAENHAAAQEALAEAQERVRSDVLQALADVKTAFARLAASALQEQVGAESLRLAQGKLAAGTITNDDVLNAQQDYSQAKITFLRDQARYTLSLYALNQATGVLDIK
jgi:outer membrane protein